MQRTLEEPPRSKHQVPNTEGEANTSLERKGEQDAQALEPLATSSMSGLEQGQSESQNSVGEDIMEDSERLGPVTEISSAEEQKGDESLADAWRQAKERLQGMVIDGQLLYHREQLDGNIEMAPQAVKSCGQVSVAAKASELSPSQRGELSAVLHEYNEEMTAPDPSKPFCLATDALETAIGACLSQRMGDTERPVPFLSEMLNPSRQGWSTIEREASAILWALEFLGTWLPNDDAKDSLKPPGPLRLSRDTSKKWRLFIQRLELSLTASDPPEKLHSSKTKVALPLSIDGEESLEVFNTFTLGEGASKKDYATILKTSEEYSATQYHQVHESYVLRSTSQVLCEPFEHFLKDLRNEALTKLGNYRAFLVSSVSAEPKELGTHLHCKNVLVKHDAANAVSVPTEEGVGSPPVQLMTLMLGSLAGDGSCVQEVVGIQKGGVGARAIIKAEAPKWRDWACVTIRDG
ncbi:hypothetical protein HPB50_027097 [Hyalomma asiaticum]|uniref:Uncharacterized protein n=1 Tax=Hyalomma asiaticum TaxID=266040 RepID=A0ACB7SZH9_HYAAI|nr:hypothetical protein HPB50_027097 [Hyalomma asiaticum]